MKLAARAPRRDCNYARRELTLCPPTRSLDVSGSYYRFGILDIPSSYIHACNMFPSCNSIMRNPSRRKSAAVLESRKCNITEILLAEALSAFPSSLLLPPSTLWNMEWTREESPKKRVAAPSRRGSKDNGESCRRGRGKKSHKGINVRRDSSLMARKLRRAPGRGEHARTSRGTSGTMTREGFPSDPSLLSRSSFRSEQSRLCKTIFGAGRSTSLTNECQANIDSGPRGNWGTRCAHACTPALACPLFSMLALCHAATRPMRRPRTDYRVALVAPLLGVRGSSRDIFAYQWRRYAPGPPVRRVI